MSSKVHEDITKEEIQYLAKCYDPLSYYLELFEMLKGVYPDDTLITLTKYELHKLYNDTLWGKHDGEQLFKYILWRKHLDESDLVGAFEIKVNGSRADFLTINGHTTSFEIKTRLDNLYKLEKQCLDYMQVFEFNYVVIAECHLEKAKELVPDSFGVWIYRNRECHCYKQASLNNKIKPEKQLELLTKKELCKYFPSSSGLISTILTQHDASQINFQFKAALKERYRQRWNFVVSHQTSIFHMDVQFFFNKNIHPNHIYLL